MKTINKTLFSKTLKQSLECLSSAWKKKHIKLFQEEHLSYLSNVLYAYIYKNKILCFEKPVFNEEIKEDFIEHLKAFKNIKTESFEALENELIRAFKETNTASILMLLGQRLTPASLRDENAFPPLKKELLDVSFKPFNEQITMATRAWEKHVGRSEVTFWGSIKGSPQVREKEVRRIVQNILEEKTWWNIYFHYKHELVYEVRVASGHGMRWQLNNLIFIGFVEPFDEEY